MPAPRSAQGTAATLACVLLTLLAGCGRGAGAPVGSALPTPTPTPAPAVSTGPQSTTTPTSSASAPDSTAPTAPTAPTATTAPTAPTAATTAVPLITASPSLTLTGTVEEGVEPDCLLLTDERTGRRVNLASADRTALAIGARITVTGVIGTNLKSYCQQGAIFLVATVRRAG